MKRISDYEEKVRIVAYFTRDNKGCVTEAGIKRVWCQWWKSDFNCSDAECDELIKDICKRVVDIQIPTRKLGRRKTLDFLKAMLLAYKAEDYKNLAMKASTINKRIQNQTSKKRNVLLGRYRIIGTSYVGSYEEINNILSNMGAKKKDEDK